MVLAPEGFERLPCVVAQKGIDIPGNLILGPVQGSSEPREISEVVP
jgi:hypothetical protein